MQPDGWGPHTAYGGTPHTMRSCQRRNCTSVHDPVNTSVSDNILLILNGLIYDTKARPLFYLPYILGFIHDELTVYDKILVAPMPAVYYSLLFFCFDFIFIKLNPSNPRHQLNSMGTCLWNQPFELRLVQAVISIHSSTLLEQINTLYYISYSYCFF